MMMHYWGPSRVQCLSTGLTSPILNYLKRISSRVTSRLPTNRPVLASMKMQAFSGSQRTRRPSRPLAFPRLTPPWLYPNQSSWTCVNEWPLASTLKDWLHRVPLTTRGIFMTGNCWDPLPGLRKQLFPFLPACAKHMKHYWGDPLNLKHGLAGLEVKDMEALCMGEPSTIEVSNARHLSTVQGSLLTFG